jgi:hypothetical protein
MVVVGNASLADALDETITNFGTPSSKTIACPSPYFRIPNISFVMSVPERLLIPLLTADLKNLKKYQ